jgi:hypothetical protein
VNQQLQRSAEIRQRRSEIRKQESIAKQIPYISFILTHIALVLFIIAAFFIDRFTSNQSTIIIVKIVLSVIAVLLLASEWIYAITISSRWKKTISTLFQLEEEQRIFEEQDRQRQHESAMAVEQLKNRVLQLDLQRRRDQRDNVHLPNPGIRPVNLQSSPFNEQSGQNSRPW